MSSRPSISLFQVVPPCGGHHVTTYVDGVAVEFQVVPPCGGHPVTPGE